MCGGVAGVGSALGDPPVSNSVVVMECLAGLPASPTGSGRIGFQVVEGALFKPSCAQPLPALSSVWSLRLKPLEHSQKKAGPLPSKT